MYSLLFLLEFLFAMGVLTFYASVYVLLFAITMRKEPDVVEDQVVLST